MRNWLSRKLQWLSGRLARESYKDFLIAFLDYYIKNTDEVGPYFCPLLRRLDCPGTVENKMRFISVITVQIVAEHPTTTIAKVEAGTLFTEVTYMPMMLYNFVFLGLSSRPMRIKYLQMYIDAVR